MLNTKHNELKELLETRLTSIDEDMAELCGKLGEVEVLATPSPQAAASSDEILAAVAAQLKELNEKYDKLSTPHSFS